ncbi:MAG: hypothetical protein IJ656_00690 [Bacilli bacterium]|nr:hypothetical protein [Bacilli bacterium]
MKKTFLFSLSLVALMVGCSKGNTTENKPLKIIAPVGAPAYAFYNEYNNENFETNAVPKNIIAQMTSSSENDIVVIDTTSGIQAINNGAPYKIASTITFGNFYIASTGNDENTTMEGDDKIILFGQGQTPDKIFHYLYGSEFDANIEYVAAASDAAACLVSGKNVATGSSVDYVFLAQPALQVALSNQNAATYGKASIYESIQEKYEAKNEGKKMMQASVFVKNTANKESVNTFLGNLKTNITSLLETPALLSSTVGTLELDVQKTKFGAPAAVVQAVTTKGNQLGLGYLEAFANKEAIDTFLGLFNIQQTNEEIYYK